MESTKRRAMRELVCCDMTPEPAARGPVTALHLRHSSRSSRRGTSPTHPSKVPGLNSPRCPLRGRVAYSPWPRLKFQSLRANRELDLMPALGEVRALSIGEVESMCAG